MGADRHRLGNARQVPANRAGRRGIRGVADAPELIW